MIKLQLTHYTPEEQRENLSKLAHGLRTMPPPNVRFDMYRYCDEEHEFSLVCGTIGCALGCATYIVTPREDKHVLFDGFLAGHEVLPRREPESYDAYAMRVFGVQWTTSTWDWLFGPDWRDTDNTPQGAATRIEWFLNFGRPQDSYAQIHGSAPLCYGRVIDGVFHELESA